MDTFEFNPMYAAQDNETKDTNDTKMAEDVIVERKQVKSKCLVLSRCWASVKHAGTRSRRE